MRYHQMNLILILFGIQILKNLIIQKHLLIQLYNTKWPAAFNIQICPQLITGATQLIFKLNKEHVFVYYIITGQINFK